MLSPRHSFPFAPSRNLDASTRSRNHISYHRSPISCRAVADGRPGYARLCKTRRPPRRRARPCPALASRVPCLHPASPSFVRESPEAEQGPQTHTPRRPQRSHARALGTRHIKTSHMHGAELLSDVGTWKEEAVALAAMPSSVPMMARRGMGTHVTELLTRGACTGRLGTQPGQMGRGCTKEAPDAVRYSPLSYILSLRRHIVLVAIVKPWERHCPDTSRDSRAWLCCITLPVCVLCGPPPPRVALQWPPPFI